MPDTSEARRDRELAARISDRELAELVELAREARNLLSGQVGGTPLSRLARAQVCSVRLTVLLAALDVGDVDQGRVTLSTLRRRCSQLTTQKASS